MAVTTSRATGSAAMLLSPQQIAQLPTAQQQQYLASLPPQQRQAIAAQVAQIQAQQANQEAMRKSLRKYAYCPVTGGSGTTATYTSGQVLSFDLPVVGSGYACGLLIHYNITFTPANGTSAAYAINQAAPWNIFSQIELDYNGVQIRTHPYILKILDQLRGYGRAAQNAVVLGSGNSLINQNINNLPSLTVGSANTWSGMMYLPLNALGTATVPGLLPIMGVGNRPQLKLTCAPSFLGPDPLLNPLSPAGGSGNAVTINSGSVFVDVHYLDGTNLQSPAPYAISLQGQPTLQYYWDTPLAPLTSGSNNRQHINTLLEHWFVVSVVIDGQQSNTFVSSVANIQAIQLSPDSVGQQSLINYGFGNNLTIYDYYNDIRRLTGQDLDAGVIIWVAGNLQGVNDPDSRMGAQPLNMRDGGFPAATHAYQIGTVGTSIAGLTPRVETFLISMNYDGLRLG
ncbi:MAG: hypothetical protein IRY83_15280 [Chloroflexi bacterium]|nr:hypothetical protein [Chloroflexota bacterium]